VHELGIDQLSSIKCINFDTFAAKLLNTHGSIRQVNAMKS